MASFYKDDNPLVGGGQIDQLHHFKIKIFRTWFLQLLSWQSAIMPGDDESVFPGVIAFRENSLKKKLKNILGKNNKSVNLKLKFEFKQPGVGLICASQLNMATYRKR